MGNVQSGDQDMVARVEMPDHGVFSNTKDGLPAAGGSGGDALASSCCPICYEEFQDIHDKDDGKDDGGEVRDVETSGANVPEVGIHRKMTLTCLHAFCWDCLGQHLETSIENKQVPLSCPMLDCDVPMSIDDVDTLFLSTTDTSNLKSKYEKLVTIKENPVLVECTRCNILLDAKDTSTNEITCDICGHAFCKEHGGIHSSMTCEAFMNTESGKKLQESEAEIQQYTKRCTRCGALLQKTHGCDYVVCGNCRGDFCYKCGTHEYFVNKRLRRTCTGCNTVLVGTAPRDWIDKVLLCLLVPLFAIGIILVYVAVFALWAVTLPFFLVFGTCLYAALVHNKPYTANEKMWVMLWAFFFPFFFLYDDFLVFGLNRRPYFQNQLPSNEQPVIPSFDHTEMAPHSVNE